MGGFHSFSYLQKIRYLFNQTQWIERFHFFHAFFFVCIFFFSTTLKIIKSEPASHLPSPGGAVLWAPRCIAVTRRPSSIHGVTGPTLVLLGFAGSYRVLLGCVIWFRLREFDQAGRDFAWVFLESSDLGFFFKCHHVRICQTELFSSQLHWRAHSYFIFLLRNGVKVKKKKKFIRPVYWWAFVDSSEFDWWSRRLFGGSLGSIPVFDSSLTAGFFSPIVQSRTGLRSIGSRRPPARRGWAAA